MDEKIILASDKGKLKGVPNFSFIVGGNGFFFRKDVGIFDSLVPVDQLPLEEVDPYINLNVPKISAKKMAEIISFFRSKAIESDQLELMCQIFYSPKSGELEIMIPEQYCSCTNIVYVPKSKVGLLQIGTIHSHNWMPAFHSFTDIRDEEEKDGIHIVVGELHRPAFSVSCIVSCNGFRKPVSPLDLIEGVVVKNNYLQFIDLDLEKISFPKDWEVNVSLLEQLPEKLSPKTLSVSVKPRRKIDYLDIAGLDLEELRQIKTLNIPVDKFITIYDDVDEEEAAYVNRDVLFSYIAKGGKNESENHWTWRDR